jgi:hypothetical protein
MNSRVGDFQRSSISPLLHRLWTVAVQVVVGVVKTCRRSGASRSGGAGRLVSGRLTVVTLNHLFGIVPQDVAMKRNATSATIHPHEGRKQVRHQR